MDVAPDTSSSSLNTPSPSGKSTPSGVTPDPDRPPSCTSGNSGTTSGATSTSTALPTGVYSRPGGKWSAGLTLVKEQHRTFGDKGQATAALTDAKSAAISKDAAANGKDAAANSKGTSWEVDETERLLEAVSTRTPPFDWQAIADDVQTRSEEQCKWKFYYMNAKRATAGSPPTGKSSGTWKEDETGRLIDAIKFCGLSNDWQAIADHVRTRSAGQCKSKNQKLMLKDAKKVRQAPFEDASSPSPNDDADDPAQALRSDILGIRFCHVDDCCKTGKREYGWMCRAHNLELEAKASGATDASSSEIMAAITPTLPKKHIDAALFNDTSGICTGYSGCEMAANEITAERLPQQDPERLAAEPTAGPKSSLAKPDIPVLDNKRTPSVVGHSKRQRKRSELDIMGEFETGPGILSSATSTEMTSASTPAAVASAEDHEVLQPTPESNWRETIDGSSGKPYYYHIITNEVTWDKPECLVALVDDLCPSPEPTKKVKGICWDKRSGKWRTEISIAGKRKHIGYFSAHEEATAAYSFLRKALDGCGLSKMDDGRFAVYENAKEKAIEAATLGSTTLSVMELDPNAVHEVAKAKLGKAATLGSSSNKKKGIYQRRDTGRWVTSIAFNGAKKNIGTFDTSDEASAAFQLVSKALGVRCGRDGAELEALFQAARKKARGEVVNTGDDDDLDDSDRPKKERVFDGRFKQDYEAGKDAETQTETVTADDKIALGSGIRVIAVRHGAVPQTRTGGTTAAITPTSTLPPKHTDAASLRDLSGVGTFSIGDGMGTANKITPEQLSQQDPERRLASQPTTGPKPSTPAKKPDIPVLDQQPAPSAAGHSKRQHKKSELNILEEYDERCKMQQVKSNILSSFRSTEMASAGKPAGTFFTSEEASAAYNLVREALGDRKCGRDSAELEASFQAAKARAAGLKDAPGASKARAREAAVADTKAITSSQNTKGYYQRRDTGKWDAQIKLKGKSKGIGSFATPEGASAAYQIVRDKLGVVNSSIDYDELEPLFQAAKKKAREEVMHSGVDIIPPDSDWREAIDDSSGNPYYYHIVTNEVTWDKPACVAALDDLTRLLRGGGTNANDPTSNDPFNVTARLDPSPLADDNHSRDTTSLINNSTAPQPYMARAREEAGADTNTSACTAIHETKGIHHLRTSGKWQAQISTKHVTKNIGTFSTSEEAFAAYQIVRIELGDIDVVRDADDLER